MPSLDPMVEHRHHAVPGLEDRAFVVFRQCLVGAVS